MFSVIKTAKLLIRVYGMEIRVKGKLRKSKGKCSNLSKNNLVIGLLPYDLEANTYIKKIRKILSTNGMVTKVPNPPNLAFNIIKLLMTQGKIKLYDILIINWRENCLVSNGKLKFTGVLEYFFSLFLHKISSRKLIYVQHNRSPHGLNEIDAKRTAFFMGLGKLLADRVVVHSPAEAEKRNYFYIPHPLYDLGKAPSSFNRPSENQISDNFPYLMIGRIEPYKRIDEVIYHWDSPDELRIIGPSKNDAYLEHIQRLSKGKNVTFDVGFHSEEYLALQAAHCSCVIIVNDPSSMIVSGSMFFALSCNVPVYTTSPDFTRVIGSTDLSKVIYVSDSIKNLLISMHSNSKMRSDLACYSLREKIIKRYFGDDVVLRYWNNLMYTLINDSR